MTQNTTLKENTLSTDEKEFATALTGAFNTLEPLTESDWGDYANNEAAAYRVQDEFTRMKSGTVGGYKVSLTSKETQDMFDSNEPLYGAEMADRFLKSPLPSI